MRSRFFAFAAVALPLSVLAQAPINPPNYRQPSVSPPPDPSYTLPPPPAALSPPAAGNGAAMLVKHVEVRGVRAFRPNVIRALVSPYENREVTSADLETLRIALTRLYVDKGFVNSGVVLPDQTANDGLVVYQAIEGKLSRIDVVGRTHLSPNYIRWRVRDEVPDPLNISDLQNALRYLQEDSNILKLDASLGAGDGLGQSVLRLAVEDQPRFSAGLGVDNHHTPSTGATAGNASLGFRDLSGYGEEFHGTFAHTRGDNDGSAFLSVPVAPNNTMVQAYFSLANAGIIQQPFGALNIDERTRIYGISLNTPVSNHLDNKVALFLGMESDRNATTLLGSGFSFSPGAQNGVSAATVIQGGVDWLLRGKSSVTDVRLTYKRGIDALGATRNTAPVDALFNPNPTGANGRFGLEQLQVEYIQRLNGWSWLSRLNDRAQLVARGAAQLSQNPLLIMEKYAIGGFDTVRGYSEDLLVRDNGANATLELQLPIPGYRAEPNFRDLAAATFIDYGRSWDKSNSTPGNPLVDTTNANYIASAGLGVLWNPLRGLDGQVYWGRGFANNFHGDNPENFQPHDLQRHGFHFVLNYVYHW